MAISSSDRPMSVGRYPVLREVLSYYLRDEVSEALFDLICSRRAYLKWKVGKSGKTHSREVTASDVDEFKDLITRSLAKLPPETKFYRYPHIEADTARYQTGGSSEPVGYDFLFESDGLSLRDNFHKLDLALQILRSYAIPHVAKFSGNTSLHVIIPWEAFPETVNGQSVLDNWPMIDASIASYLRVFGRTQIDHEPKGTLPFSLSRKTGLVSMPVAREELETFEPWMANLHNVTETRIAATMAELGSPKKVRSTRRFLSHVLAWHPPRILYRPPDKGRLAKCLDRVSHQAVMDANSRPVDFWVALLDSERESDRVRAGWALIWHKDREKAAGRMGKFLSDPSPDLRYFLVRLIVEIGPDKFPRGLKEALRRSCRDRHEAMALEDLMVCDGKEGLSMVLSSLVDKKSRWAVQLETSALRRMELRRDQIHELLISQRAGVRMAAAMVLGAIGDQSSTDVLERALEDPDREVRMAAVSSLGLIGKRSSMKALRAMLVKQPVVVRRKAIQALSRICDPEALQTICTYALEAGSVEARREAVRVLEGRPGKLVEDTLLAAMRDKSVKVRVAALRVLVKSRRKFAMQAIAEARQMRDRILRREAEYWAEKHESGAFPLQWSLNNV